MNQNSGKNSHKPHTLEQKRKSSRKRKKERKEKRQAAEKPVEVSPFLQIPEPQLTQQCEEEIPKEEAPEEECKHQRNALWMFKKWRESENKLLSPSIERKNLMILEENVGEGTNTKVSMCLYGGLYVAVKEFGEAESLNKAKWEAEILVKLKHPNVSLFIGCEFSTLPYIVVTRFVGNPMEPPLTVTAALQKSRFPFLVPFWIRVLTQIADALLYLHVNAKVIHNDLKADNVMLEESLVDEDGVFNATLIDFGKSSIIGLNSGSSSPLSGDAVEDHIKRYPHVAPELWKGACSTAQSDIYSYGHLLKVISTILGDQTMKSFYIKCKEMEPQKRPSAGSCVMYLNSYKFH